MLLVDDPIDRQKIDGCQGATQEDAVNIAAVKPVSYTHLDV